MSGHSLPLLLQDGGTAPRAANVAIENAVIAGWTGRDAAAVEKHIRELEVLGVKRPATTPIFYRVAAARLTTAPSIEVLGGQSSGEVEFVLLQRAGALWVGTGSDHTDREVEAYGVSVSSAFGKQRWVTHLDVSRADLERALQIASAFFANTA